MKKTIHLFNQRMFHIFHSKDEKSGKEIYENWDKLLDDIDNELFGESELELDEQEKNRLKELLREKSIRAT